MTEDTAQAGLDLDLLERIHAKRPNLPECGGCYREWPCEPVRLVWEVRRLRAVAEVARETLGPIAEAADWIDRFRQAGDDDDSGLLRWRPRHYGRLTIGELRQARDVYRNLDAPAPPHVAGEG